jgi:hypothetical protein
MIQHCRYASLLQHDLRYPDPVWISRVAPGQIPVVRVVPAQQLPPEFDLDGFGLLEVHDELLCIVTETE